MQCILDWSPLKSVLPIPPRSTEAKKVQEYPTLTALSHVLRSRMEKSTIPATLLLTHQTSEDGDGTDERRHQQATIPTPRRSKPLAIYRTSNGEAFPWNISDTIHTLNPCHFPPLFCTWTRWRTSENFDRNLGSGMPCMRVDAPRRRRQQPSDSWSQKRESS